MVSPATRSTLARKQISVVRKGDFDCFLVVSNSGRLRVTSNLGIMLTVKRLGKK